MNKCQICKEEEAEWAWQPLGPSDKPDCYTFLGSHYRGFPVIKVGSVCRNAFESGDFPVEFTYKGIHFIGRDHQVKEVMGTVDLWDGGTSSYEAARGDAQIIMRSTIGTQELVAMVSDTELLPLFLAAPQLLAACEEIDSLYDKIEFHLEMAASRGLVADETLKAVFMALAKVRLAIKAVRGEL